MTAANNTYPLGKSSGYSSSRVGILFNVLTEYSEWRWGKDERVCVPPEPPEELPVFFFPSMDPSPPGQCWEVFLSFLLLLLMMSETNKTGTINIISSHHHND